MVYDPCPPVVYVPSWNRCGPRYGTSWSVGVGYSTLGSAGPVRNDWNADVSAGVTTVASSSSAQDFRDWQDSQIAGPTVEMAAANAKNNVAKPSSAVSAIAKPSAAMATQAAVDAQTKNAWTLLEQGRYEEASKHFASSSAASKDDAQSRVGYALAAALMGKDETATWAMRRAFATNADAVGYIPLSDSLSTKLDQLAASTKAKADGSTNQDKLFLLASIEYLRHHTEDASGALEKAVAQGDYAPSTRAFMGLVGLRPTETTRK
ncbi:MAG TPA: hypothetical protein VG797_08715 [Phycisphaerales bacterium]|nr:hypothetical protein [Phycisphaerales bacterium]